jgi:hypothetical protein
VICHLEKKLEMDNVLRVSYVYLAENIQLTVSAWAAKGQMAAALTYVPAAVVSSAPVGALAAPVVS